MLKTIRFVVVAGGLLIACASPEGGGAGSEQKRATSETTGSGAAAASSSPSGSAAGTGAPAAGPPGMALIAAGSYPMGDDASKEADQKPAHQVTFREAFYVDRHEATVAEYRECVVAGACAPSSVHGPGTTGKSVLQFGGMCNESRADRDKHPINCVDREQAAAYCSWRGKRLPTEAEWEAAARGTEGRKFPWGADEPTCDFGRHSGGCHKAPKDQSATMPVGSHPAGKTPEGVHDLAGNVWEWVQDGYNPVAYRSRGESATDPKEEATGAHGILRGGSWDFAPSRLVATWRLKFRAESGHVSTGFRCVVPASAATQVVEPGKAPRPADAWSCTEKCKAFAARRTQCIIGYAEFTEPYDREPFADQMLEMSTGRDCSNLCKSVPVVERLYACVVGEASCSDFANCARKVTQ